MAIEKEHKEFYTLNMDEGWEVPEGYPSGIQQKILSGRLDEENKRGHRTRLCGSFPVFTQRRPSFTSTGRKSISSPEN